MASHYSFFSKSIYLYYFSLAAMSAAVDGLSTSAPLAQINNSVTEGRNLVLSPGGYSYGGAQAHSSNPQRSRTLKQARGTGRKISNPNQRSYSQLVEEAEKTPGAEIRIVQSNEGFVKTKAQKIRMKYYDSCRKMYIAENRSRASSIQEGENQPLLGDNPSINRADGFLEYPMHLLPPSFYHLHLPGQGGTQSSIVTM